MAKHIYEIDGRDFATLEEFYEVIGRVLIPQVYWGHNLDAFNDILRGGFGTPEDGFILRWVQSSLSRQRPGYPETVRELEWGLSRCHPTHRSSLEADLEQARRANGPTVFDWLIEIIKIHSVGGDEELDAVDLELA